MTTDSPDLRETLAALGQRREERDQEDEELAREIKDALLKAFDAGISKSEAARLLKVHRTTLYRVYDA